MALKLPEGADLQSLNPGTAGEYPLNRAEITGKASTVLSLALNGETFDGNI